MDRQNMTTGEVLDHLSCKHGVVGGRDINFLYCPTDFSRRHIKGYAVINFLDADAAAAMVASGADWAKLQGYESNAASFLRHHDRVRNAMYRPVVWPSADDSVPATLWKLAQATEQ